MYQTRAEKKWTVSRGAAILAAVIFAIGFLALSASPARASFPGANGKIDFQSERTGGPGVHNPEGDYEIFAVKPDGSDLVQLTDNNQPGLEPSYSAYGNKIAFVRNSDIYPDRGQGKGGALRGIGPGQAGRQRWRPERLLQRPGRPGQLFSGPGRCDR